MSEFITFNINAFSNFLYILITNIWFLMLGAGAAGTILLRLKDRIDNSIREEQNII